MRLNELKEMKLIPKQQATVVINTGRGRFYEQESIVLGFDQKKNHLLVHPLSCNKAGQTMLTNINICAISDIRCKDVVYEATAGVSYNEQYNRYTIGEPGKRGHNYNISSVANGHLFSVYTDLSVAEMVPIMQDKFKHNDIVIGHQTHVGQPRAYADSLYQVYLYTRTLSADELKEFGCRNHHFGDGWWYDKVGKFELIPSLVFGDWVCYQLEVISPYTD